MNYTITENPTFNSIEIAFEGKPSEEIRQALKNLRFRWHGVKKERPGRRSMATLKKRPRQRRPQRRRR